jgi:hypothetical protein
MKINGGFRAAWANASEEAILNRAALFFGYLIAMILVMLLIGQNLLCRFLFLLI